MYRNLLVPVDGSAFAEQALPLALSLAERSAATVHMALAHLPITALYTELPPDPAIDAAVRQSHNDYLSALRKRISAASPVRVESALLQGPTADALAEHALGTRGDLIVMATHGRGPMSRFWLGSVADKLIRRSATPVLLIRPVPLTPALNDKPALRRILIPLDGSALAEEILPPATELGALTNAEYTLLRAVEPVVLPEFAYRGAIPPDWDATMLCELQREAQTYLERVATRMRLQSLDVRIRVVSNKPAATAILEQAEEGFDLIALATHGRGGLARMLLGSVADKVVRGAPAAVLIHHPSGK
jgi:nucleotide-binding universal stress UspA family protein